MRLQSLQVAQRVLADGAVVEGERHLGGDRDDCDLLGLHRLGVARLVGGEELYLVVPGVLSVNGPEYAVLDVVGVVPSVV